MTIPLRPMNTGELLDRSFSLYRNNFVLFAGIGLLPPVLKLGLDAVQLATVRAQLGMLFNQAATGRIPSPGMAGGQMSGSYLLLLLVYLLGFVLASGATVYAVSMVHLDKKINISGAYKAIASYFLRLIGIFLLIVVIMIGLGIVAIGVPVFAVASTGSPGLVFMAMIPGFFLMLHLYACLSLSTSVCVVEKSGVINSLKRSLALSKGARGKIWLVFILFVAFELVLYMAVGIPAGIIGFRTRSLFLMMLIIAIGQFFVTTLLTPILTVPLVLIYYDQRVKKEAFDLHLIMQSLGEAPPAQASAATPIG